MSVADTVRHLLFCVMLLPGVVWGQVHRLAPDSIASFGFSVSAHGSRIAIGAPEVGTVHVYSYDSATGWLEEVRLDGPPGEKFGYSVALEREDLLIGAPEGGSMAGGTAYLFRKRMGVWQQTNKLEPTSLGQGDKFGSSVALSGIYAFVGAPRHAADAGALYAFVSTGQSLHFVQMITTLDPGSLFGSSIALTSEYAVIGAPAADEPRGRAAGKAFIYGRTGGSDWVQRATLVAGDARTESGFGTAVSIDLHDTRGSYTVFVGAPKAGLQGAGAAYLFKDVGGLWTQLARYVPPSRTVGDRVGESVVVNEDNFLVGMPGKDSGAGAAVALVVDTLVYAWQENAHQEAAQRQTGASFAHSMAMSDLFAVVGAPNEMKADSTYGVVYVYTRSVMLAWEQPTIHKEPLSSYPNPFREAVRIVLQDNYEAPPMIDVYDFLGRYVASLPSSAAHRSGYEAVWRPSPQLPAGIYGAVIRGSLHKLLIVRVR